jgi:hypothetical protein
MVTDFVPLCYHFSTILQPYYYAFEGYADLVRGYH